MNTVKRNAVILAAGTSSRFVPLSFEFPKALLEVKGEILIERQIRQLQEAGINDITVVTGYKAGMFGYLKDKFGIDTVHNEDYKRYNNTSSMIRILDRLSDTYICSSDNYFVGNVFKGEPVESYYSALYADGPTKEYCLTVDFDDNIEDVKIGGADSWYMVGHVYFDSKFSTRFREILVKEYEKEETRMGYWEDVYIRYLRSLPFIKINRYQPNEIEEFDSLDELRRFDHTYIENTRSKYVKKLAERLRCSESSLTGFSKIPNQESLLSFSFMKDNECYCYNTENSTLTKL